MVNTTKTLTDARDAIKTGIVANFTYLAVGTNNTAPTAGDTALGTEVTRKARQEYTSLTSSVIVSLWLASGEGNGSTYTEVGVFDAAAAGNMFQRSIFTGIAKTAAVELWIDVEELVDVTQ